jgi:hypothetical protein
MEQIGSLVALIVFGAIVLGTLFACWLLMSLASRMASGNQRVRTLGRNDAFLNEIRSGSCYPVLRGAHAWLTIAALVATSILWVVLLTQSPDDAARVDVSFVCVAVIVALLIEFGLFRLMVDAVDVLIDKCRLDAVENQGK